MSLRPRRSVTTRSLGLVAVCIFGVALTWILVGGASSNDQPDGAPYHYVNQTNASQFTLSSDSAIPALLRSARLRVRDTNKIVDARIGPPPQGVEAGQASKVLYATVDAADGGSGSVFSRWQALVFGGIVRELLRANGLGDLSAIDTTLRLPDGQLLPLGGGIGNVIPNQVFDSPPDPVLTARITRGARSLGLQINTVRIIHSAQPIPVVVATARNARDFAHSSRSSSTWTTLLGEAPSNLEGYFLEVDDIAGAPIVMVTGDNRVGGGAYWIRPEFAQPSILRPDIPIGSPGSGG